MLVADKVRCDDCKVEVDTIPRQTMFKGLSGREWHNVANVPPQDWWLVFWNYPANQTRRFDFCPACKGIYQVGPSKLVAVETMIELVRRDEVKLTRDVYVARVKEVLHAAKELSSAEKLEALEELAGYIDEEIEYLTKLNEEHDEVANQAERMEKISQDEEQ